MTDKDISHHPEEKPPRRSEFRLAVMIIIVATLVIVGAQRCYPGLFLR